MANSQRDAHQELPKERRSDLQVPPGDTASADPGSEGTRSLRADGRSNDD